MNKILATYGILFFSLWMGACQPSGRSASDSPIAVSWKLLSNFTDTEEGFRAQFELINKSNKPLEGTRWALFFNMAPRPILPNKTPQPATVQHLNGDWYKLVPNEGFRLAADSSVVISYEGTEGVIKETDAPLGLYLVFYDQNGGEEQIVLIDDYQVLPFTTTEQTRRGPQDEEPASSAAQRYQANLATTEVDSARWLKVLPTPVKLETQPGTLALTSQFAIHYTKGLETEARLLAEKLEALSGLRLPTTPEPRQRPGISLRTGAVTVNETSQEAYQLRVQPEGVDILGSDAAGVFYGTQSLLALLPVRTTAQPTPAVKVPYVHIEDAPRFHFRGLHLDVSRNFQTKESILRVLDLLAFYKVNHFLFYTTEDEGWRLEIDGLPELTEVGAQRQHVAGPEAAALHPAYGSGPVAYAEGQHGSGYYSKADFVEILKYAKARHIKVIPELNFPGHARAAIKAMEARYERLLKAGKKEEAEEYRLIDPDDRSVYLSAQGYKDNVVSVARESTYRFYEKVVDEMAKMYREAGLTMDVIHAGGDEVPEGAWTQSPLAAQLLKQHPEVGDPHNLHAYFFKKLLARLQKRNLTVHGWEEVALLKMPDGSYQANPEFAGQGVAIYIWNNLFDYPDLGYRLANANYPVILCNVSNFYFDLAYDNDPQEPGLYWAGFVNTRDAYAFAPFDMFKTTTHTSMGKPIDWARDFPRRERLKPAARKNILGLEAQLWSETVKGRDMLEYYLLPKLLGFAESAWAPARKWETSENAKNRAQAIQTEWDAFATTLARRELPRLSLLNGGYAYRVPPPGAVWEEGTLKANTELPGLTIRYTTDGSEPSARSTVYTGPVKVPTGAVRLRSFDAAGRPSRVVNLE
ncbi:family 20 glycosylhydrolase [Rhabdobacter roseus]|uniref:beta-N-acetylhexosaminidase n=1 Tax=Rhabdobacter roseus TaxID=1655419 RepID=A0A840THX3_9BACT|nr:family 20 glycosylhydrolase [Rhabdobacter roseus]MBB5282881.1 hexosaminidase [Rhabdobacter roseus]